ncbi:hypothetical protein H8959_012193 [Pygathrix nigripes]
MDREAPEVGDLPSFRLPLGTELGLTVPTQCPQLWSRLLRSPQHASQSSQQLMERHSTQAGPEEALKLERPPICKDQEPTTASQSTGTATPRSHPPLDIDAATSSQGPEDRSESVVAKPASAEVGGPDGVLSQLPLAKLFPPHNRAHQLQMLERSLREEELRAQHQAALLHLREMALQEKTLAELAWLEHRRGCLDSKRDRAVLAVLVEKQQQALSRFEKEQREIQYLRHTLLLLRHRDRKLLLQHQRDVVSMPGPAGALPIPRPADTLPIPGPAEVLPMTGPADALLIPGPTDALPIPGPTDALPIPGPAEVLPMTGPADVVPVHELQARAKLPQGSSPKVKATWEGGSETSQQPEASLCSLTLRRPSSPTSRRPQSSPVSSEAIRPPVEQQDMMPPQTTSDADGHQQPPRPAWGEDTHDPRSPLVESRSQPSAAGHTVGLPAGRPPHAQAASIPKIQSEGCTGRETTQTGSVWEGLLVGGCSEPLGHMQASDCCQAESGKQPRAPQPGLQPASPTYGQRLGPAFPAEEAEGRLPTAQRRSPEAKEPLPGKHPGNSVWAIAAPDASPYIRQRLSKAGAQPLDKDGKQRRWALVAPHPGLGPLHCKKSGRLHLLPEVTAAALLEKLKVITGWGCFSRNFVHLGQVFKRLEASTA